MSATSSGSAVAPAVASRVRSGRLTWRLFTLVGAVVIGALALSLLILTVIASRTANAAGAQALDRAAQLVSVLLTAREQSLARAATVFVQNPIFRALVLAENADDLRDQSGEGAERTGATWVQITNANGVRLAKSDDMAAPRIPLTGSALIARALGGDAATGFGASSDTMLLQVIAVPVTVPSASGEQSIGAFMAAQVIDSALAAKVKEATDTDVIFYVLDTAHAPHVSSSSLGRTRPIQDLVVRATGVLAAQHIDSVARFDVRLGDEAYVGRAVVVRSAGGDPLGGFLALRAQGTELAPFESLRRWILLAGVISLVLGMLVAFLLARSIAGPVLALASAARRAAEGDYDAVVGSASRDEVGELTRAVGTMLLDLREKRSLVTLLQSSTPPTPIRGVDGTTTTIAIGSLVAERYEIRSVLGSGGAGVVYKAFDRELGELVALKTLHPEAVAQDPAAVERLKSEIRLARRITHRGVVRIYDLGEHEGTYFLSMEFVAGTVLSDLLERDTRLPLDAVISIARQLARALEVAHAEGIIHRDIKPQNIMLRPDGTLKVMDFGIARLAVRTAQLTQVGMAVGTPGYMAPEQLMDADVDARADLYACGVVLYECITGVLPHDPSNPVLMIGRIVSGAPVRAPHDAVPGTPRVLSDLIMRLIAADPAARCQSAAALRLELSAPEIET
ncbi:MAG: protein kinase [Gemmatimonadaceae bacterium]|nr:protein kinase [Gemmatimonadaceae bacterium]